METLAQSFRPDGQQVRHLREKTCRGWNKTSGVLGSAVFPESFPTSESGLAFHPGEGDHRGDSRSEIQRVRERCTARGLMLAGQEKAEPDVARRGPLRPAPQKDESSIWQPLQQQVGIWPGDGSAPTAAIHPEASRSHDRMAADQWAVSPGAVRFAGRPPSERSPGELLLFERTREFEAPRCDIEMSLPLIELCWYEVWQQLLVICGPFGRDMGELLDFPHKHQATPHIPRLMLTMAHTGPITMTGQRQWLAQLQESPCLKFVLTSQPSGSLAFLAFTV